MVRRLLLTSGATSLAMAGIASPLLATPTPLLQSYLGRGPFGSPALAFRVIPGSRAATPPRSHPGCPRKAFGLWQFALCSGVHPPRLALLPLLSACVGAESLPYGRVVHVYLVACRTEPAATAAAAAIVETAVLSMYGRCGRVREARLVFDGIAARDAASWNAMIAAYARNGCGKVALELFERMDLPPDRVTFLSALDACAREALLTDGKMVHERLTRSGFGSDVFVQSALLNMYGKCGSLNNAKSVFGKIRQRDVVTWTAMIAACTQNDHAEEALEMFERMGADGVAPNRATFLCALEACTDMGSLEAGRDIHKQILARPRFESDVAVRNALINMYGKCSSLNDARVVFDETNCRNVVSWTSIIATYAHNGHARDALELFRTMDSPPNVVTYLSVLDACASLGCLEHGKTIHAQIAKSEFCSDIAIGNALVNMYSKCGSLANARAVFDGTPRRNVISWSTMIAVYTDNGLSREGLELFLRMGSEGIEPNKITFISLLDACSSIGSLESGRAIHRCISSSSSVGLESDIAVKNALLNMYSKCGSLGDAQAVFDTMRRQDAISWNCMIAAHSRNGRFSEALSHLHRMDSEGGAGARPNGITFLAILNACNHAGLWEEGWLTIVSMKDDYGVTQSKEHYMCMVDLFGRAGRLSEAEDSAKNMPACPDAIAWTSLLSAC